MNHSPMRHAFERCLAIAFLGIQLASVRAEECGSETTSFVELGEGELLGEGPAKEHSGIVKSRQWPDLFWMQNDSGDEPRIYPVRRDGKVCRSERYPDLPGVEIAGAINVDWEDIAVDAAGNIVVADIGNNGNDRRDLAIYVIPEPAPDAGRTIFARRILFRYPQQKEFPAPKSDFNYDAEAIFVLGTDAYVCSKNRSDTRTNLYRIDLRSGEETQEAELVDSFDVQGQATGADISPDGKKIVVCTYERLWLFQVTNPQRPLSGPSECVCFDNDDDVEAVCFADRETLIVGAEAAGRIFEVSLSEFSDPGH